MTDSRVYQAARVIVGHCPECRAVVVVLNGYEVWPYVVCSCGAQFATTEIVNHMRFERGGIVQRETNVRWRGRGASEFDPRGPTDEPVGEYDWREDAEHRIYNESEREQEST